MSESHNSPSTSRVSRSSQPEELYELFLSNKSDSLVSRPLLSAPVDTVSSLSMNKPDSLSPSLSRPLLTSNGNGSAPAPLADLGAGPIAKLAEAFSALYLAGESTVSMEMSQIPQYQDITQNTEKLIVESTDFVVDKMKALYDIGNEVQDAIDNACYWNKVAMWVGIGMAIVTVACPLLWEGTCALVAWNSARVAANAAEIAAEVTANTAEITGATGVAAEAGDVFNGAMEMTDFGAARGASQATTDVANSGRTMTTVEARNATSSVQGAIEMADMGPSASANPRALEAAQPAATKSEELAQSAVKEAAEGRDPGCIELQEVRRQATPTTTNAATSSTAKSGTLAQDAAKTAATKPSKVWEWAKWGAMKLIKLGAAAGFCSPMLAQGLAQNSLAAAHEKLATATSEMAEPNMAVSDGKYLNEVQKNATARKGSIPPILVHGLANIMNSCQASFNAFINMANDIANIA